MKSIIKKIAPPNSHRSWIISGLRSEKLSFLISLYRSLKYTFYLKNAIYPVNCRVSGGQELKLNISATAKIDLSGVIYITPWGGETRKFSISLGEHTVLKVEGDFIIGPGVHISVSDNGHLGLGGRKYSSGSGITCNTRIMTRHHITIGHDVIISWGVFISDSDWHWISWDQPTKPIIIGDNVWISHDASVLKGSKIGNGCIVGAKSLLSNSTYPEKSLIAGSPAKVVRHNVEWSR
jgi:acetyltransferase-like isoleucine patch superfamily enzyme